MLDITFIISNQWKTIFSALYETRLTGPVKYQIHTLRKKTLSEPCVNQFRKELYGFEKRFTRRYSAPFTLVCPTWNATSLWELGKQYTEISTFNAYMRLSFQAFGSAHICSNTVICVQAPKSLFNAPTRSVACSLIFFNIYIYIYVRSYNMVVWKETTVWGDNFVLEECLQVGQISQ